MSDYSGDQRAERVAQLINLFQLNGIEGRFPRQLSGGQLQKVALARTLAPQPRLLLLDEPLSALDDPTRSRLRSELRRLLIQVGIPTLLVTHDRLEAIALGDRLVVMVDGRIQQTGPVREVFSFPANHAVAQSVGTETLVPGEITEARNGLLTVQAGQVQITSVDPGDLGGREVYLCIRAEDVIVERGPTSRDSARNHLSGHITSIIFEGVLVKVMLDCGIPLCALVTRQSCEELNLKDGDNVTAIVKATAIHLVPRTPAPGNG